MCCDMQLEDGATQTLFWENLNVYIIESGVPSVNFMANSGMLWERFMMVVTRVCSWLVVSTLIFPLVRQFG